MKRTVQEARPKNAKQRRRKNAAPQVSVQTLIDRAHGAAFLDLTRVHIPSGCRTAPAIREDAEQVWCLIQGEGCFHRAGEDGGHAAATPVRAGDALFIPPGYDYWMENSSAEDLVYLCCTSQPMKTKRAQMQSIKGEHAMADRYEYKILVSDSDDETDEETLNGLGEQGWELVNAVADVRAGEEDGEEEGEDQNVPVTVFYFKRRRE